MKKTLCLLLVLCTLLSCVTISASAENQFWTAETSADGYSADDPDLSCPDPSVLPTPELTPTPEVTVPDESDTSTSNEVITDQENGGTINLAVGESRQMSVNAGEFLNTIRSKNNYVGSLTCTTTIRISNGSVAKGQIISENSSYVIWTVTGVSGGITSMTVTMEVTSDEDTILGLKSHIYTIVVPQEKVDIPSLPEVYILSGDGSNVTGGTVSVDVDEKNTLSITCASSGSGGYFTVNSVLWSFEKTEYADVSRNDACLNITGLQNGEFDVTASVTCGYMAIVNGKVVDQGNVGVVTVKTTVKIGNKLTNPFEGIDPDQVENPFSDLTKEHWAYDYMMLMYAAGMYQYTDFAGDISVNTLSASAAPTYGLFKLGSLNNGAALRRLANSSNKANVDVNESRGNTVANLYPVAIANGGVGSYTTNPFQDMKTSMKFYQPVLWAYSCNVVKGYGKGKFGPYDGITREQMCAILVRLADELNVSIPSVKSSVSFKDAGQISSYAKNAVDICQRAGIINGVGGNMFNPKGMIKRGEVAAMIVRFVRALS